MINSLIQYYEAGGWMIWPMAFITAVLWYALGYRFIVLKSGLSRQNVRNVIKRYSEKPDRKPKSMIDSAVVSAQKIMDSGVTPLRPHLDEDFSYFIQEMKRYNILVKTIVYVAPLMGLLGTVTGMIETFDSLSDMTLHSQSGGIAGGISQALVTTQLGLTIAIPGLLINSFLNKKQERVETELNQIKDIMCSNYDSPKVMA